MDLLVVRWRFYNWAGTLFIHWRPDANDDRMFKISWNCFRDGGVVIWMKCCMVSLLWPVTARMRRASIFSSPKNCRCFGSDTVENCSLGCHVAMVGFQDRSVLVYFRQELNICTGTWLLTPGSSFVRSTSFVPIPSSLWNYKWWFYFSLFSRQKFFKPRKGGAWGFVASGVRWRMVQNVNQNLWK